MILWPLFGSLNQLMGALALGVVTVYMYTKKQPFLYTLLPMVILLVFTLWAMIENLAGFVRGGEYLLVTISVITIIFTLWLLISATNVMVKKRLSA